MCIINIDRSFLDKFFAVIYPGRIINTCLIEICNSGQGKMKANGVHPTKFSNRWIIKFRLAATKPRKLFLSKSAQTGYYKIKRFSSSTTHRAKLCKFLSNQGENLTSEKQDLQIIGEILENCPMAQQVDQQNMTICMTERSCPRFRRPFEFCE